MVLNPSGLSLAEVNLCWGREPEAPRMKRGNERSGHRPDCLFWILTHGPIRTPFLNAVWYAVGTLLVFVTASVCLAISDIVLQVFPPASLA